MIDGEVELSNAYGRVLIRNGEQGEVVRGQAPRKTAVIETINIIQWCLYYPGVIDIDELKLPAEARRRLATSLEAYRQGDVLGALRAYPMNGSAGSESEQIYRAAVLLTVGQVDKANAALQKVTTSSSMRRALETLIAAVKYQPTDATGTNVKADRTPRPPNLLDRPRSASEWVAQSYYEQSRANLENALAAAKQATTLSPSFGFAWTRVAELEFSFGRARDSGRALEKGTSLAPLNAAAFSLRLPDRSSKFARAALPAGLLGAESVLLSVALFGFMAAGLRLLVTAAAVALLADKHAEPAHGEQPTAQLHWRARASEALDSSGPWLALGLLLGGLLSSVPASSLSQRPAGMLGLGLLALIANLAPVAAPAAVLIATGLSTLGFSPGAVLLFATLAPISAFVGNAVRPRLLASAACLAIAAVSDRFGLSVSALDGSLSEGDLGPRAATALVALLILGVWRRGARIWLSTIVPPPPHEHEHAHDVRGPHAH